MVLTVILCGLVLIGGITWFGFWGKSQEAAQWVQTKQRAQTVKEELTRLGTRQQIIVALHEKLQKLPADVNSAKGWFILGKLYFNEKKISESLSAFRKAAGLKPDEPEYLLQFVSVKFLLNKQLDTQDKAALAVVLKLVPNNINAVNLLALDAYQHKHYQQAIHHWERMLAYFPAESQDSKTVLLMIHQARNLMAPHGEIKVKVSVKLASNYQNKISPNDVLFVYALEKDGSRMPVAVLRLSAKLLPTTVILDDSTSMIQGRSLSEVNQVYVEARVSKSGNALPSKGEYVGKSPLLHLKKGIYSTAIVIDQML
jgi:cytochrome c-type biogenesis protein CcmH